MDFRFSAAEEDFRTEIRSFLAAELPADWSRNSGGGNLGEGSDDAWQFLRSFQKKLSQKGWLTLGWPVEYGGKAAGVMQQVIYNEEMSYHRAPTQLGVGPDRVGPTIILYGTDEQKERHLPGIANADSVWCQGFSEPGAGSDLAGLETKATIDGDEFVVNGQKIWTSLAHKADWCVLLVRTDQEAPKHKGISYLLVDMRLPGITVAPLVDITGRHAFNQIFFQDVRVPRDCLVGELNRGWYVGAATLDFERSGINRVVAGIRVYEELVEFARQTMLADRDLARIKLAELGIELAAGKLLAYRVASMQAKGQIPNAEASMSKMYGSELQQRIARSGMQIMGLAGQLESGQWAPLAGRLEHYYLSTSGLTVAAGTTEIQKNIIAGRGLGLPRG
ncbi:MAG: acyl-CoA dehydrogenase family protein [Chloroflexota bacterium]